MRRILGVLFGAVVLAGPVQGQNLLSNFGFETGSLLGWTVGGTCPNAVAITTDPAAVHTGTSAAAFTGNACESTLSQTLTTVSGDYYTVGFWAKAIGTDPTASNPAQNGAGVYFGPEGRMSEDAGISLGWQPYSYNFLAHDTSIIFSLRGFNDNGTIAIDDISVVPLGTVQPPPGSPPPPGSTVPEPSSVALLATGLLGVVPFARRKKRLR